MGAFSRTFLPAMLLLTVLAAPAGCSARVPVATLSASYAARYADFAVAADHPVASAAGAEILARGGNAVDAAVATSFCLAVVRPYSCGIGGGGFMLVHIPESGGRPAETFALDYRETAPAAVDESYYTALGAGLGSGQPEASRLGVHAAGVPGTVAGLLYAHERWGRLDRAAVLAPAIRAAREGYLLDAYAIEAMEEVRRVRDAHPALRDDLEELWRVLCDRGRQREGDLHRNPDLAQVLEAIARDGAHAFYRGAIARRLTAFIAERGGAITDEDLAAYAPVMRTPLLAPVRFGAAAAGNGAQTMIATMPPPSSGGIALLQIFGILERIEDRDGPARGTAQRIHRFAEAMQHAFADRAAFLADPDFVDVPVQQLLARATLDGYAGAFDPQRTQEQEAYGTPAGERTFTRGGGTSHFCVIDADGMAVACTETVNLLFGSMIVVPGLGFPLNNEMDDFTTQPGAINAFGLVQSEANLPQPGKRPLSSMTPTIALDESGRVVAVIGASGGPRIITGSMQVLYACLHEGLEPADAMIAPRVHHQWLPRRIDVEPALETAGLGQALGDLGHTVGSRAQIAHVQAIFVRRDGLHAVSDPRKGGKPAGGGMRR